MRQILLLTILAAVCIYTTKARTRFRIPITIPTLPTTTATPAVDCCASVLVKLNPSKFPQCACEYCDWGKWKFSEHVDRSSCPSGRAYKQIRTRSPIDPSSCTKGDETEIRYDCEPTIEEKANNFVDVLQLGGGATSPPISKVVVKANNVTVAPVIKGVAGRNRRADGFSLPCPGPSEKRICDDVYRNCRGRRSVDQRDLEEDNILLADLVQAQARHYESRKKRQALPATDRNIFLVVDSSGSIGNPEYVRTLNVLSEFAGLFCGNISLGLLSYSYHIELEFCPTCLRNLNEYYYRIEVQKKIKEARYHASLTHTAETIKCLSDYVLPSPDCRLTDKRTQVVFFTDGKANGCLNTREQLNLLENRFPTLETYAIGMGPSIAESGVADLLGTNFDPLNVFNVENVDQLEELLKYIRSLINGGSLQCAPGSFS